MVSFPYTAGGVHLNTVPAFNTCLVHFITLLIFSTCVFHIVFFQYLQGPDFYFSVT